MIHSSITLPNKSDKNPHQIKKVWEFAGQALQNQECFARFLQVKLFANTQVEEIKSTLAPQREPRCSLLMKHHPYLAKARSAQKALK